MLILDAQKRNSTCPERLLSGVGEPLAPRSSYHDQWLICDDYLSVDTGDVRNVIRVLLRIARWLLSGSVLV